MPKRLGIGLSARMRPEQGAVPSGNRRHKHNSSLAVVQLLVAQAFAWLAFTGSVNSGRSSHNVVRRRLECCAAGFSRTADPQSRNCSRCDADADPSRPPRQLPLKQHRLRLTTLRWRHDYPTFRFVAPSKLGSRKFCRRVRYLCHSRVLRLCRASDLGYMR
jgi:hypothetical protein